MSPLNSDVFSQPFSQGACPEADYQCNETSS